jgi:hypothetical protein
MRHHPAESKADPVDPNSISGLADQRKPRLEQHK